MLYVSTVTEAGGHRYRRASRSSAIWLQAAIDSPVSCEPQRAVISRAIRAGQFGVGIHTERWCQAIGGSSIIPLGFRPCFHDTGNNPERSRPSPETERVADARDLIVDGGTLRLEAAGQTRAQVTFACDIETFLLLMWGRLALETVTADGQVPIAGDRRLAADFGRWYKGF